MNTIPQQSHWLVHKQCHPTLNMAAGRKKTGSRGGGVTVRCWCQCATESDITNPLAADSTLAQPSGSDKCMPGVMAEAADE